MNTNGALCYVPSSTVTVLDPFLADDQSQIQSNSNDQSKSDKTKSLQCWKNKTGLNFALELDRRQK